MTHRLNYIKQSPELFKKLIEFSTLVDNGIIEQTIRDLVAIRASQINGCAFCLDMHIKEAKIHGERELRIHHLAAWRESTLFVPRERAALAWTEVLTKLPEQGVPDDIYERAHPAVGKRTLGTDLQRHGHQRMEPREHRVPDRAWIVRQGLRPGQGQPLLSFFAGVAAAGGAACSSCAIHPSRRRPMASREHSLLRPRWLRLADHSLFSRFEFLLSPSRRRSRASLNSALSIALKQ